jgi:hypothetical protein
MRLTVTWDVITYHSGEIDIDDQEWAEWSEGKPATPTRIAEFLRAGAGRESISSYLPEDSREWKVDEAELDERSMRPKDCQVRKPNPENKILMHTWCLLYEGHPGEHLYEDA